MRNLRGQLTSAVTMIGVLGALAGPLAAQDRVVPDSVLESPLVSATAKVTAEEHLDVPIGSYSWDSEDVTIEVTGPQKLTVTYKGSNPEKCRVAAAFGLALIPVDSASPKRNWKVNAACGGNLNIEATVNPTDDGIRWVVKQFREQEVGREMIYAAKWSGGP